MTRKEFLAECDGELKPIQHLIRKAASTDLNWRPRDDMMSTGQVMYHLSEGIAEGLRCLQTGQWPFSQDTMLPTLDQIKTVASAEEALSALEKDRVEIEKLLDQLTDQEFATKHVDTPWGMSGSFWRVAFSFVEHWKMHKMQLFLYLRIQGLPLNTADLYVGEM